MLIIIYYGNIITLYGMFVNAPTCCIFSVFIDFFGVFAQLVHIIFVSSHNRYPVIAYSKSIVMFVTYLTY